MFLVFIYGIAYILGGFIHRNSSKPDWDTSSTVMPSRGYRSERSMKSQAAWDFAQVYYYRRSRLYTGVLLLVMAVAATVFPDVYFKSDHPVYRIVLPLVAITAATILPRLLTEKKLKQLFDKEGNLLKRT